MADNIRVYRKSAREAGSCNAGACNVNENGRIDGYVYVIELRTSEVRVCERHMTELLLGLERAVRND